MLHAANRTKMIVINLKNTLIYVKREIAIFSISNEKYVNVFTINLW